MCPQWRGEGKEAAATSWCESGGEMRCGTAFVPPDETGNGTPGARATSRVHTLTMEPCNPLRVGKLILR